MSETIGQIYRAMIAAKRREDYGWKKIEQIEKEHDFSQPKVQYGRCVSGPFGSGPSEPLYAISHDQIEASVVNSRPWAGEKHSWPWHAVIAERLRANVLHAKLDQAWAEYRKLSTETGRDRWCNASNEASVEFGRALYRFICAVPRNKSEAREKARYLATMVKWNDGNALNDSQMASALRTIAKGLAHA